MISIPNILRDIADGRRQVTFQRVTFALRKGQTVEWDIEIDCAGLLCPLPVLRARKRLVEMEPGQVLRVRATDPMAAIDVPHFCAEAGHAFLGAGLDQDVAVYLIERGKGKGG